MSTLLLSAGLVTIPFVLAPEDWPTFLGPNQDGRIDDPGLSYVWGEDGPPVRWKVSIGPGYGGVAVRDGEVYLLDREVGVEDVLRVYDLDTGAELWSHGYEAPGRLIFPGSRTVPTVVGDHVYTSGGFGHVTCFDRKAREVVWSVSMEDVYEGLLPSFGWANSPLVVDDLVIVSPLGEYVGLLALDRRTGEEAWVTEAVGYSHSSPALIELLGQPQIVFLSAEGRASGDNESAPMMIRSFHPVDGSLLWEHRTELCRLPIPGPTRIDDERFFVTGGYRGGSTMMRLVENDSGFEVEELFHIERGSQVHRALLHGEHLYLIVNENWNQDSRALRKEGGLLCLDLGGNEVWRTADDPYFGRGNSILVGDHLLVQDGFNGVLRVAHATPAGYQEIASANVFGIEDTRRDRELWAPMALAGTKLLMRSQEELVCLDLAPREPPSGTR